ncbi:transmembrane protease serine 9-like isoform X2 [Chironomus tepperi]|uniref:transmembrane protease serine 9-like isoform X2 n=1 Tax=Chironomus tepperi TaxID=113505 RepID=UPI00391FBE92
MSTVTLKLLIIFILIVCDVNAFTWNLLENGPKNCGKSSMLTSKMYYGKAIFPGEYPWHVAIIQSKDKQYKCGGTLVSNNLVITAAHCIISKYYSHSFNSSDILVVLGVNDLSDDDEIGKETVQVEDISMHDHWFPNNLIYDADIAIIKLKRNITFNEYIQPVCIAVPNSEAASKTEGIVVGFGRSENTDSYENIARVITSPIYSYEICVKSEDHSPRINHRMFCGGYANGTSVCEGDSGGGFIVQHNGISYLRGIVSSAMHDVLRGCNVTSYAMYTNVLEFYSWITTGKKLNFEPIVPPSTTTEKIPEDPTCYDEKGFVRDCRISEIKCKQYERLTHFGRTCQHNNVGLVAGGIIAKKFEFPHHALLGYKSRDSNGIDWLRSGSLISPNFVLTSAHGVKFDFIKYVKLGMNSRSQDDDHVFIYGIEKTFRYTNSSTRTVKHDIGLLKLNDTVQFSEYLYPICLPTTQPKDPQAIFTGFGRTEDNRYSDSLLKVVLDRYSIPKCQDKLIHNIDEESMICYGKHYKAAGPCKGDGGGALLLGNDKFSACTYKIIGISSFGGLKCEAVGVPSVYTNVYYYLNWIESIVWN